MSSLVEPTLSVSVHIQYPASSSSCFAEPDCGPRIQLLERILEWRATVFPKRIDGVDGVPGAMRDGAFPEPERGCQEKRVASVRLLLFRGVRVVLELQERARSDCGSSAEAAAEGGCSVRAVRAGSAGARGDRWRRRPPVRPEAAAAAGKEARPVRQELPTGPTSTLSFSMVFLRSHSGRSDSFLLLSIWCCSHVAYWQSIRFHFFLTVVDMVLFSRRALADDISHSYCIGYGVSHVAYWQSDIT